MSNSPKYSAAQLAERERKRLEEERRRKAEEEARRRREEEERQRRARLEALRNQSRSQAEAVAAKVSEQQSAIYAEDATALHSRAQELRNTIHNAQSESQLQSVPQVCDSILQSLNQAISRKRRDDEEKKRREELEKQQFELEELERLVSQIPEADAIKFDAPGREQVQQELSNLKAQIATGNPEAVRAPLATATTVVQNHADLVTKSRAEWQRRKALAEEAKGKLEALIAGLKADEVVMRWHGHSVAELEALAQKAAQHIAAEEFEQPGAILTNAQSQEKVIVEDSNTAQLKADQRDYITDSVVQTLQGMGFFVSKQADYPDHPATAMLLRAVTPGGKSLSVSVPCEGNVLYDVDGYSKSTEAAVGGGTAAVCDEAEQVIEDLHSRLEEEFGVEMGELGYDGRDPLRQTRRADELPRSEGEISRGAGS